MGGGMHCKDAKPDNCRSYEHCRDKTLSESNVVVCHDLAGLRAVPLVVNKKNLKSHTRFPF
jgi:hypothetical protein